MKKLNSYINNIIYLFIAVSISFATACNKGLEQFDPLPTPVYPTGTGLAATIAATATDSLYAKIITKSGLSATLNDNTKTFTMFVPDNNAVVLSFGGTLAAANAAISAMSASTAKGIVQYNTIGLKFPSTSFVSTFPNYPLPTQIVLSSTTPFVRMPIFPSKGSIYSYVNNIPVTAVDQAASNGIIHHTYAIVAPPTATLKAMIATEPTLSYFRAAIARADSGSVGLSKFDSLLNYALTNMTVLAPNDGAFQNLVYGLVYSQVFALTGDAGIANAQATAAVAAGPAFLATNNVTTAQIQGIVAYHILASNNSGSYIPDIRAFSENFPSTAGFVKTLVNSSISVHPGIMVQASFTGPAVTSLQFTGYGTFPSGGAPFSGSPVSAVSMDKLAVNGVYHIINGILLPQ